MRVEKRTALKDFHQEFLFAPSVKIKYDLDICFQKLYFSVWKTIKRAQNVLPRTHSLKFQLRFNMCLEKFHEQFEQTIELDPWFSSEAISVLGKDNLQNKIYDAFASCKNNFDAFVQEGSGWTLKYVICLSLLLMKYKLFSGACFLKELPHKLKNKKGIIFLKNTKEGHCFLYAVASALLKEERNSTRITKAHHKIINLFPSKFLKFPINLKDITEFEKETLISVNIFGFDKSLFPFFISEQMNKTFHVDLLLHKNHFYAIKSLSSLISTKVNRRKTFVCTYCLSYFINLEKFRLHVHLCTQKLQKLTFPSKEKSILKFNNFTSLIPYPFIIYADIESVISEEKVISKGKVISRRLHLPIAVASNTVCTVDDKYSSLHPFLYVGYDCIKKFIYFLQTECKRIEKIKEKIVPLTMTRRDVVSFNEATHCFMCQREFSQSLIKVRDHCHLTGKYRFCLCDPCNLNRGKTTHNTCVFFHGLNNYDHHFVVTELAKYQHVKVIPKTSEKFLSFTVGSLIFKDSFEFLGASLSSLVKDLKTKGENCFKNVNKFFPCKEERKLLYRKGIFPYNYISSKENLKETSLPSKETFFNDLTKTHISEEDYLFALHVWDKFKCKKIQDYLCIYLLADVLLLSDVFENFRETSIKNYSLDPAHFLSNAQYTMNAFLRFTNENLELFTDVNKYLFIQKAIRGGVAMGVKRYAKANNQHMKKMNKKEESSYIVYLDCNNLYGLAMMQYLPVSNFRWLKIFSKSKILECLEDANDGYIVECTLEYPSSLHSFHSDFPLAPQHASIDLGHLSPLARCIAKKNNLKHSKSPKLLCTLYGKHCYVLHYRTLQLYISLGMKIIKIHKVLKFKQRPVLKSYIQFNTKKRANCTNSFDSNYFKLMSNSLFGKTIERPDKRMKVSLVDNVKQYEKYVANLNLKSVSRINENLVSIQSKYTTMKINKPLYLGMCVLDIAKFFIYDFHYNVMARFYSSKNLDLLYTDTDSLIYHIKTKNVFEDFEKLKKHFDFSNYPSNHFLFSNERKKIPGFFKDESCGQIITEFIVLKAKMYAFLLEREEGEKEKEVKIAKGVHKSVVAQNLKFANYYDCLFSSSVLQHEFSNIQSKSHTVFTSKQKKISLSSYDDKRYLISLVKSYPYGHVKIC